MHGLRSARSLAFGLLLVPLAGCPSEDDPSADGTDTASDTASTDTDGTDTDGDCAPEAMFPDDDAACMLSADYYEPGADDQFDACVTDDGTYTLVADTPSSIARVEAYESIMSMLRGTPTPEDFTAARTLYAEDEGLESRLQRREDLRYPEVPMEDWQPGVDSDKQCSVESNVASYPDRCAGPAKLAPAVEAAFVAGQMGEGVAEAHVATLDALFLWFYYISTIKEANTCFTSKAQDCDSSWAYYTGGNSREGGIGLAGRIRAVSPEAHEAIWDGFSAFRCIRDLYPADDDPSLSDLPPEAIDLFDAANAQLHDALAHGVAELLRAELQELAGTCGTNAQARWTFVTTLSQSLPPTMQSRDSATAAMLSSIMSKAEPTEQDLIDAYDALGDLFPCPSAQ